MGVPSLTGALSFFETLFNNGRTLLSPSALLLLRSLVIFEVIFAGLYLALGGSGDLKPIARKVLLIGFLAWIVQNYTEVLTWVIDGFLYAGERAASGTPIDIATLKDPHALFVHGMQVLLPLERKVFQGLNSSWFGLPSADSLVILICLVLSVLCYGLIAIQVFVSYLEFIVLSAAGFILVPFGAFKPTAFLSERVFGAIVGMGVKLLVLALIVGATDSFIQTMQMPPEVTHAQSFQLLIVNLALAFLSLHAPGLAMGLLSGHPTLSAASVAATALGTGVAAGVAVRAQSQTASSLASIHASAASIGSQVTGMASGGKRAALRSSSQSPSPGGAAAAASPMTRGQKLRAGALGAASGVASGLGSIAAQRLMHGSDFGTRSSAAPRDRSMIEAGYSPDAKGIAGSFQRGAHAVPTYREMISGEKKSDESQGEKTTPSKDSFSKSGGRDGQEASQEDKNANKAEAQGKE